MKKIAILMATLMLLLGMLAVFASCSCNGDGGAGSSQSGASSSTDNSGSTGNSTTPSQNPGNTDNSSTDNSTSNSGTDTPGTNSSTTTPSTDNSGAGSSTVTPPDDQKPQDDPNLVKVTVINRETGKGVNGAAIQICQGETCFFQPIKTGADGVGTRTYDLKEGQLKAKINSITGVDDFIASNEYVYFDEGSRELVIYVQRVVINVFDDKEQAVDGAKIQLQMGENTYADSLITDPDGMVTGVITLHGGELSARVTEVLSGGAYDLSQAQATFESGEYGCTIIAKKKATYSVRVATMFGDAVVGAQVKLYADGFLEDVVKTNENGIATFENLGEGDYSVEVIIVSPAYEVIGAGDDGKFHFTSDSTTIEVTVVTHSEITYTVSVSTELAGYVIDVYNVDDEIIETIVTDENGIATFVAPNGYYTAVLRADNVYIEPAYFVYNDSAVGKIKITNKIPGASKESPIILLGEVQLNLEAGQTVWFAVPNGHRKVVSIVSTGVKLDYNDDLSQIVNGTFNLSEAKGQISIFSITADEAQSVDVSMKAPGTHNNPFDVTDKVGADGYTEEATIEKDTTIYYSYTAKEDGTLCVTTDASVDVHFDGDGVGLVTDDGKHLFPLSKGETVLIAVNGFDVGADFATSVKFNFGEEKVDYTIYVNKDGDVASNIVVILYKQNGDELTEVVRGTTGENGRVVFADVVFADNYVVKVEYPEGYTSNFEEIALEMSNYGSYSLTRIKTGAADAPFDFDTVDEMKETAEVKENGTVWYTLYVRPSQSVKFTISANSANAVIKVYNADTNEDGIIDENDTPIGMSAVAGDKATYTFETNNMFYTIAVSTQNGANESILLEYTSEELAQGTTEENAIEVTESGTYTADVNGITYYVFSANEGCKLTITLNGEANLCLVERSMAGSTLVDVENNTLTIEDTMGNWIYFAISAENAGEYEFTVTVE